MYSSAPTSPGLDGMEYSERDAFHLIIRQLILMHLKHSPRDFILRKTKYILRVNDQAQQITGFSIMKCFRGKAGTGQICTPGLL